MIDPITVAITTLMSPYLPFIGSPSLESLQTSYGRRSWEHRLPQGGRVVRQSNSACAVGFK